KAMTERKAQKEQEQAREADGVEVVRESDANKVPGSVTFTDYDSVYDLIADTSGDQVIRKLSELAWVAMGDGKFILTTNSGNYLVIEPSSDNGGSFRVKY